MSDVLQRGNNGNDFGKFESDPILSLFHAALVGLERFTVPELDLNCVRVSELECPNALLSEIGVVDASLGRSSSLVDAPFNGASSAFLGGRFPSILNIL